MGYRQAQQHSQQLYASRGHCVGLSLGDYFLAEEVLNNEAPAYTIYIAWNIYIKQPLLLEVWHDPFAPFSCPQALVEVDRYRTGGRFYCVVWGRGAGVASIFPAHMWMEKAVLLLRYVKIY